MRNEWRPTSGAWATHAARADGSFAVPPRHHPPRTIIQPRGDTSPGGDNPSAPGPAKPHRAAADSGHLAAIRCRTYRTTHNPPHPPHHGGNANGSGLFNIKALIIFRRRGFPFQ